MPVVSSRYWNMVHGSCPDDVRKDEEGLAVMRTLGSQLTPMYWYMLDDTAGKLDGDTLVVRCGDGLTLESLNCPEVSGVIKAVAKERKASGAWDCSWTGGGDFFFCGAAGAVCAGTCRRLCCFWTSSTAEERISPRF